METMDVLVQLDYHHYTYLDNYCLDYCLDYILHYDYLVIHFQC